MNRSLENKLIDNYWINKLKLCPIINDSSLTLFETEELSIKKEELSYFNKLTSNNKAAEFTVLLTLYSMLLNRYFESQQFIASSGVAEKKQVLLYKFQSLNATTLKESLTKVKQEVQEVFKYSSFDTSVLQDNSFSRYTSFGFSYNEKPQNEKSDFPFYLTINKKEDGLTISISYDNNFTIEYVANHFLGNVKNWLCNLENYINATVDKLPIISEQEKEEVLYSFNDTKVEYPKDKTIIDLFEEQVEKTPTSIALVFEDKQLTYTELNEQVNQLAHNLRETYTIQPDDLIGIKLERSEQLIVAILGILKSGAAYVPIDINYPKERINYIEKHSACKVVIDEEKLKSFATNKDTYSNQNLKKITKSNHLAYIMYTSGTTGNSKGVMVEHGNVIRLVKPCLYFPLNSDNTLLSTGSTSFDATIIEYFGTLLNGSKLIIASKENLLNTDKLKELINNLAVNSLFMTSSWFSQVVDQDLRVFDAIHQLLVGGDVVSPIHVVRLYKECSKIKLFNGYGPTENTTLSTTYAIENKKYTSIPIGKPISNSYTYILDANLAPTAIGVPGKLYVSGAGVARGYLNNPDLTAERFIENPFIKGERMYDTGDLAKWLPDGNIAFLGRKDTQVKIRGFRIELEEIENTIIQFSDAIQQVVLNVSQTEQEKELVAYYVSKSDIEKSALRDFLQSKLPSYMVPSYYMALNTIPLTTNGKVDRKGLPKINSEALVQKEYTSPRTEVEKQLVAIWQKVLGIERIGITDNFFELGGHSLLVGQIINSVYKQLNKSITYKSFFESPTIEELSKKLSNSSYHPIPKTATKSCYPLTTSQHRIWILNQLEGGNLAYNMPGAVTLKGDLDILKFEEAFKILIKRHEILRTNFKINELGEVHQYITQEDLFEFNLLEKDITHQTKKDIEHVLQEEHAKAFDLANELLVRAVLFKTQKKEHIFSLTMHHIIGDGWSMELVISEVISTYNNLVQNKEYIVPKLEIQYKDYAVWLQSALTKEQYKVAATYWRSQFQGELPIIDIPSFKSRPKVKTYNGHTLTHHFSTSFLKKLTTFSKSKDVTLFMTIMAGINTLLYRYTNQNDIIIGTPIAGREHPDLEGQLGLYLNTLAIRTNVEGSYRFLDVLERQKQTLLAAYEHQNYPFDELVNKLNLQRDTSRSPLFDVMVVLQNQAQLHTIKTEHNLSGIQVEDYEVNRNTSQFDLSFTFIEKEGLVLSIEYDTDIYDEFLIERMFTHFENVLSKAIDNSENSIASLTYIIEEEKKQILEDFNDTKVAYSKDKTVIDLFEEQVAKTPDHIALVFKNKKLTYTEFNKEATLLAQYLIQKYDIQSNDLIGIKLERSEQVLIAIFGILKSRAAYVPIDISYPQERINYIENDCDCKLVIDEKELESFKLFKHKNDVENLQRITNQNQLAYIIYTSGTTGNPKGVLIKHRNLSDYSLTFKNYFNLTNADSLLQQASISFDTSIEEIFPILLSGGKLVVIKENNDFDQLFKKCEEHKISILSTNPYALAFLNQNVAHYQSLNFRTLISGGDTLNFEYINNLHHKFEVYNTYGPTESTVCATYYKVESQTKTIPIGKPIANRNIIILNDENKLQPIGVAGELCISGLGLASGYLNKEEITKEKFINHPFIENNKMYKSGDLARWLPDGTIEFLGRIDQQVKLRGYRIELGEIETVLKQYAEEIENVVVAVKEINEEKVLIAYYISSIHINKSSVKDFLQKKLPNYMIPDFYMQLDSFELTPNGKINRKALPNISGEDSIRNVYIAPKNDIEIALVAIWEEVLGIEKIGVTDNFFELGGHSLKITKLRNLVNKKFNTTIRFNDLFIESSIKNQSKLIEKSVKSAYEDIPKLGKQDSYIVSSSQRRIWMLSQFEGGNVAYNMPGVFILDGHTDVQLMKKAFQALIERHEALRTRFKQDAITGEIRQIIKSEEENNFKLIYEDTRFLNATESELKKIIEVESNYNFDLANENLLRAKLIKTRAEETVLIFVIHHIISDGWSLGIITNELFSLYNAFLHKKESPLQPLPIQYKEYAAWEQNQLILEKAKESKKYWELQFQGEIPVVALPSNKKRQAYKTYNGKIVTQKLPKNMLKKFSSVCQSNNSTLFMGLVAIVKFLIYKYSNQNDLIIGTPIAGREHALLQNQIGIYINTLALRTKFKADDSFETLLEKVKETTLAAYEHQLYPFDKLVSDLPLQRDLSRNPLFDVMVTLQNTDNSTTTSNTIEGLQVHEYVSTDDAMSKFDLEFIFEEKNDELEIKLLYNSDIFEATFIDDLQTHLCIGIESCSHKPNELLYKLPFLTLKEETQLLHELNDTEQEYAKENTFVDYFKKQVTNKPNAVAVIDETKQYSYQELDTLSTQIATYLTLKFNHKKDALGVLLDRSVTTIALLLGILKSGKSYIPLDPTFPVDRLKYIINHSGIKVLICSEELSEITTDTISTLTVDEILAKSSQLDETIDTVPTGNDTAYIIYTSGSTGNPKGVEVGHRSLLNFLISICKTPGIKNTDTLFAVTTYSFDISILEFFAPLISGASVYIVSNETLVEPEKIIHELETVKPTIIQATPSFYQQLFNADWKGNKELKIVCGGDVLSESLAAQLLDTNLELWNMYGPTETTIWSTTKKIEKPDQATNIGKPIANTTIYVVDEFLQLQPKGTIGHLFIGGDGLAKGYFKQKELTAQRFIKNPFSDGFIYETGDVVKWNTDNELIFLGRNDTQVKIRGYRIELGDIESKMNLIETISKAIVVAKKDPFDDSILTAYFTSENEINVNDLRVQLKKVLPYYMIPSQFIKLDAFPLTPNKKIDRKVLVNLEDVNLISSVDYIPATTEIEKKLVLVWHELLGVAQIGIKDNFFDLGGHSLSVIKLTNKIQKEFSIKITVNKIFEHPILEEQSRLIENIQVVNQNNISEDSETEFENFII
ncbi:amino acid adenylation domain-containing protein [Kordia sp.]|uniref:non-ribosomal peptide synthetase n=1 Tax=Kordia sp. TaxID=1965332 RepID=UPI003D26CC38